MRALKSAPALAVLWLMAQPALGQTVTDDYGQSVLRDLDGQVTFSRELRIENFGRGFDVDRSVEILKSVTAESPDYYRAWYNLGLAYNTKYPDNPDLALEALLTALRLQESGVVDPDKSLYNTIGFILLNQRRYDEAEKYLKAGLEVPSSNQWTNSALLYNLGRLHFERLQYDESLQYLNQAIEEFGNPAAIELKAVVEKTKR